MAMNPGHSVDLLVKFCFNRRDFLFAKRKLSEMNSEFVKLKTEREKKAYIKQVEAEMMAEFEGPLRKLTISQGKLPRDQRHNSSIMAWSCFDTKIATRLRSIA